MRLPCATRSRNEQQAWDLAIEGIEIYNRIIENGPKFWTMATSVADIDRAREEGRIAMFYLFQNSTQFGRDLDNVDRLYDLGVRSSQMTYNHQNWAAAGCKELNDSGLTKFGHQLVEKMNDTGMLIDLSHAGMKTMADTIAASKHPVIVSHSCCMALFDNERNTTDENIRAIAEKGGLFGVTQMRPFMTNETENAVHRLLRAHRTRHQRRGHRGRLHRIGSGPSASRPDRGVPG